MTQRQSCPHFKAAEKLLFVLCLSLNRHLTKTLRNGVLATAKLLKIQIKFTEDIVYIGILSVTGISNYVRFIN